MGFHANGHGPGGESLGPAAAVEQQGRVGQAVVIVDLPAADNDIDLGGRRGPGDADRFVRLWRKS